MGKPKDYYHPFNDYPLAAWKEIHDINLTGTFLCAREAAKIMEENAGGSMVFTASVYGVVAPDLRIYEQSPPAANIYGGNYPLTTPAAYSSSKGALISLARYLAVALAPTGIRVNVLTPGGVYDGQDESFHSSYVQRTPLGRMAVWSDFNGAILFLVSDASRYMTGANLVIDGGWTAW
jgi:NAD(P)-dependent dehydrogenase (short-subunit alcohol dehydrogenase family)